MRRRRNLDRRTAAAVDPGSGAEPAPLLRVAYILHRFPHLTETFIVQEMRRVREHGIELSIFSLMRPKGTVRSREAQDLVPLARYSRGLSLAIVRAQLVFLGRSPVRYLRALWNVVVQTYREPKVLLLAVGLFPKSVYFAHEMRKLGIDHIHAHFAWIEGLAAGVVGDLLGTSFTIHPHAFGLFGRDRLDVARELEHATRVVTISEYHRTFITDLSRLTVDDIDVVHCGVDPDRMGPSPHRPSEGPMRILSVGRAVPKKGHEYLIDACHELLRRGRSFQCEIVVGGGGRDREALQSQIDRLGLTGMVTLLGARDSDAIVELLHGADVFALACVVAPSGDRDGIPVSLMEAMACEVPVVSTPVAGIPELVEHEETGLLVPERDAVALADALERLLDDEGLRRRLGGRGRTRVLEEFDIAKSAAQMAALFRRVVAERSSDAAKSTDGAEGR